MITTREAATGKAVLPGLAITGSAASLAFSPDGSKFAAASDRGRARLWNTRTGLLLHEMEYRREAYRISFSKDSKSVLIATGDNYTDLCDAQTGASRLKLREENSVLTAEFDPVSNRILTAGSDSRAHLWNAATGQHDGAPMQFGAAVVYASFSDDGRLILTASRDHTARVWDAAIGQPVGTTLEHPAPVGRAALSPDGQLVATIAGDKAVRLWASATGDAVAPPMFFEAGAYAAFSPDNRSLLLAGGSTASIVDRAPLTDAPAWLADLAEFASTLNNHSSQSDLPRSDAIKANLRASSTHDAWTTFGRWYFTDILYGPSLRGVTCPSSITSICSSHEEIGPQWCTRRRCRLLFPAGQPR